MLEQFKKYMCSNCKGYCDKGIVIITHNGMRQARCVDYVQKEETEGYKKPEEITAKRSKALMRLNI